MNVFVFRDVEKAATLIYIIKFSIYQQLINGPTNLLLTVFMLNKILIHTLISSLKPSYSVSFNRFVFNL